jgi:hypothetical protein
MLRTHRPAMRFLLCLLLLSFAPLLRAEEPLLKPNDVVALVGGEDMVVASELGYLEAFVQMALPDYKLKFRSLAWEGDTVFEQRRDLNYPPLEAQLDRIGATVVIAQFGQVESLAGAKKAPEFAAAYEKLLTRLRGESKRRVIIVEPTGWSKTATSPNAETRSKNRHIYWEASCEMLGHLHPGVRASMAQDFLPVSFGSRDGMHLNAREQWVVAFAVAADLLEGVPEVDAPFPGAGKEADDAKAKIAEMVAAKNRLWFNYARPQNWAFLAGDRTNQPSSRDHVDRNKRWFPEELEKFVPLIEAKEKEIWELAAKFKP